MMYLWHRWTSCKYCFIVICFTYLIYVLYIFSYTLSEKLLITPNWLLEWIGSSHASVQVLQNLQGRYEAYTIVRSSLVVSTHSPVVCTFPLKCDWYAITHQSEQLQKPSWLHTNYRCYKLWHVLYCKYSKVNMQYSVISNGYNYTG